MKIIERKEQGSVIILVGGEKIKVPITLTVIDTYHKDGRKDCTVKIPMLQLSNNLTRGK